jgi:hypothetical protein
LIGDIADARHHVHDVYIVGKCYDASSFLVLQILRNTSKLLGVDLFDDYFSQYQDSRLIKLRSWLQTMASSADFILVSTPRMRDVAHTYAPCTPVHIMNDPSPPFTRETIRTALRKKLERFDRDKTLHVGWFGIGDNPYFPVGLSDLVAFGSELARLRGPGRKVQLNILTNKRAMTTDRLAMLHRLPVHWNVEEWTEKRETALLARSLVCFLPVSAQNFSIAKSLNRAVTALCSGTQVLSSGYPLYEPLAPLMYRDPGELNADIGSRRLALREDTIDAVLQTIEQWASVSGEAKKLGDFLAGQCELKASRALGANASNSIAIIHGRESPGRIHKLAKKMGALSVASPYATQTLDYDVRFSFAPNFGSVVVSIAEKYCGEISPDVCELFYSSEKIGGTSYRTADLHQLVPDSAFIGKALAATDSPIGVLAGYAHVMVGITKVMRRLFPEIHCCYSEQAAAPFWVPSFHDAAGRSETA